MASRSHPARRADGARLVASARVGAPTVIHWFRRDLRLDDNPALNAATAAGEVVPVFVIDPAILGRADTGAPRVDFLLQGLRSLDDELGRRRSGLVVVHGDPREVLPRLAARHGAQAVFLNRDYEPYAVSRDRQVETALRSAGVRFESREDDVIVSPDQIGGPRPYRVFTAFYRAWLACLSRAAPRTAPARFKSRERTEPIPSPADLGFRHQADIPAAGAAEGHRQLNRFARSGMARYAERRDQLDVEGSSRLSPYLRFGMVSLRQCLQAAHTRRGAGAEAWVRQLAWRDFFRHLLLALPQVATGPLDARMRGLEWSDDPRALDAWKNGQTGYPVVDAAMRQLAAEAWMPNRARLIVASFLVKDLGVSWQQGELVFMQRLVDGDLASNNGGWQWVAGTGTDAQPYFRIFNPLRQAERFDPNGTYVRRWCPELGRVPSALVHRPWAMTTEQQRASGCVVGHQYPFPVVDHRQGRVRTIGRYAAVGRGLRSAHIPGSEPA